MPDKPRKWLILIPLLIAIAAVILLVKNRAGPEQTPLAEQAQPARVLVVPSLSVIPRVIGYGNVAPERTWDAVAEINGRIVELHADLKRGEIIPADAILVKIDPSDYQLTIAQTEADIRALEAQLAELDVKEANTQSLLDLEKEALALAEKELNRKQRLLADGSLPRSTVEQEQRGVLSQRQSKLSLVNSLNLIPTERRVLEAQLVRAQVQLQSAQRDLDRTTIRLPFTARIAETHVELTQFVRQGEVLVGADSIDVAEIAAQLPLGRVRELIQPDQQAVGEASMNVARRVLGLEAEVRLPGLGLDVVWQARFVRASDAVDEHTRTLGLVVAVDQPYRQAQPGIRPPLVKGMFAEVELRGKPLPDSLVIPLVALHDDHVYVVGDDNRLQRRPVTTALTQNGFVVVAQGLSAGERVVLSDLIPAIEGMLLDPMPDEEILSQLKRLTRGDGA